MDIAVYIMIAVTVALFALGIYSTISFNRKAPMSREEFEEYEKKKREAKKHREEK